MQHRRRQAVFQAAKRAFNANKRTQAHYPMPTMPASCR